MYRVRGGGTDARAAAGAPAPRLPHDEVRDAIVRSLFERLRVALRSLPYGVELLDVAYQQAYQGRLPQLCQDLPLAIKVKAPACMAVFVPPTLMQALRDASPALTELALSIESSRGTGSNSAESDSADKVPDGNGFLREPTTLPSQAPSFSIAPAPGPGTAGIVGTVRALLRDTSLWVWGAGLGAVLLLCCLPCLCCCLRRGKDTEETEEEKKQRQMNELFKRANEQRRADSLAQAGQAKNTGEERQGQLLDMFTSGGKTRVPNTKEERQEQLLDMFTSGGKTQVEQARARPSTLDLFTHSGPALTSTLDLFTNSGNARNTMPPVQEKQGQLLDLFTSAGRAPHPPPPGHTRQGPEDRCQPQLSKSERWDERRRPSRTKAGTAHAHLSRSAPPGAPQPRHGGRGGRPGRGGPARAPPRTRGSPDGRAPAVRAAGRDERPRGGGRRNVPRASAEDCALVVRAAGKGERRQGDGTRKAQRKKAFVS